MKFRFFLGVFAIMSVYFCFSAEKSFAQVLDTDISLYTSPQFPNPNDSVIAKIDSYTTDLDKAYITWSVDGKQKASNIGKKSFSFFVGNSGEETNLEVKIETLSGSTINKSIVVSPSSIDLLWEATDSYVPPFYKGKALGAKEAEFKVVAMPAVQNQGSKINIFDNTYTWTKDNSGQPNSSGWGKNSLTFKNTYLDETNTIEVETSSLTGENQSKNTIKITPGNPKILFYEQKQNLGIDMSKTIEDGFSVSQNGSSILAVPYFFSPKDIESTNLSISWSLNGERLSNPSIKNLLSIQPEKGKTGTSKIMVEVNNPKTFFQKKNKQINVNF